MLVRVFVGRTTSAPPSVSLSAQFVFVALAFAAGTWYWSDVPWSHFFAAFLGVTLFVARFAPARVWPGAAALTGVVLGLLALTRTFELVALLLAWLIALALLWLVRLYRPALPRVSQLLWGAGALAATVGAVYLATGKTDAFVLYENHLDRQSGAVEAAEVARTPTFSPSLVPIKVVQLFVEPCFYASCRVADYVGGGEQELPLPLEESSGQERLWRLPLAVQLPALVFLPVCILVVAGLVVWFVRHRERAAARARELRLLLETTIAATGIVVGYAASTMTGSAHLRYGFARDFLLPSLLTGIVAVSLGSAGLWLVLSRVRRSARPSSELVFVCLALSAPCSSSPESPSPVTEGCRGSRARSSSPSRTPPLALTGSAASPSMRGRGRARRSRSPSASTLTFGCGSDEPRFTIYAENPTEGVALSQTCPEPRLVAAWPTVMGLPPGSYELQAISVVNA